MAVQTSGLDVGICTAAADLSGQQFRCVKVTAALAVNVCGVLGEGVSGILQNKPTSGQEAIFRVAGVSKAAAGAAVAVGAKLMTDATGRVITAATAGSKIIGEALEAAGAAGEIITVLLNPAGTGQI